jgi:ubiquinone/menaquinone biosynthesis C-methylase UbiE
MHGFARLSIVETLRFPEVTMSTVDLATTQPYAANSVTARTEEDTRGAWDRIAPGYDRTNTETQIRLGTDAVRSAELCAGMRFLDVAAGSGALSIPAARLGAQVCAIDQSPVMLELLLARAQREGLDIEIRLMDGHALDLEDDSFDMAGSQFGVMLFADMPRGIREMARVVRPGGRVLMVAYGDVRRIDFLGFFIEAVRAVRPPFSGPPLDPPPLPFQLQNPARLRNELAKAGLAQIRVDTITETTEFRSGGDLWDWIVWSNPIVEDVLRSLELSSAERATIKQTVGEMFRRRADDGRVARLSNPVNIGLGTKPTPL